MSKLTTVTAENGVTYNVRLVEKGDRYGLNMCRIHDEERPMVEFYDAEYQLHYDFVGEQREAIAAGAVCLGQHVSSYYVETLVENIATTPGLHLSGGVPRWVIDGDSLRQAFMDLDLWQPTAKSKIVVVWDSSDPDTEPELWLPPHLAEECDFAPLDRSQELGGRESETDPADIALLEAGTNAAFPGYIKLN